MEDVSILSSREDQRMITSRNSSREHLRTDERNPRSLLIRGPLEARIKEFRPGTTQSLSATLPLNDCYKTPHQIPPPPLGWDTVLTGTRLLAPFAVTLFFSAFPKVLSLRFHSAHVHKDWVFSISSIQIQDHSHDFLQCFLPASPGSLGHHWQMHHQLPALFLRGAQFSPASTGFFAWSSPIVGQVSLLSVSSAEGKGKERIGPLALLLVLPIYVSVFNWLEKIGLPDFNWQGPPGSFQEKRRYLTSV